jgi:hypothetical protein
LLFEQDLTYEEVQCRIAAARIGLTPLPPRRKFLRNISTKMFEYLNHAIPQIVSDTPANAGYMRRARSGFCIGSENYASDFAARIIEILDDYPQYARLAEEDKERLAGEWNWNPKEERRFLTLIHHCLYQPRRESHHHPSL